MITVDSREDLNTLYISIFETFSLHPEGVIELPWPTTYTRQMLATLVKSGLVVTEEAEDGVYYQSFHTYDEWDVEQAQAAFDNWFDTNATSPERNITMSTATSKPSATQPCLCGCGEASKGFYRPGHDARHAGNIGRLVAADGNGDHYADLPSPSLIAKAKRITETTLAKANKSATPPAAWEDGIVKVGKTEFVGQRNVKTGEVKYIDLAGEIQHASKTATKSFQVG